MGRLPRYPIYVPSKGRHDVNLTARFLRRDGVPFRLVVEPQERDAYASAWGDENVLVLPFSNLGLGSIPARNWIWEHAKESGVPRHWVLDDNIRNVRRWWKGKRIVCDAGPALAITEDFVDRYENVAIAGLNYSMFAYATGRKGKAPFHLNAHVYSCMLILTSLPQRWRGRYNEDVDLCLQVLTHGWCTILLNVFLIEKMRTMTMKGGNTSELYQGDGRLKMARSLERMWPGGVVKTTRKFGRPQHLVANQWLRFDTKLKLKPGVDLSALPAVDEHGLKVIPVTEVRSAALRALVEKGER